MAATAGGTREARETDEAREIRQNSIAVVGAGISGLTCARALADAGRKVVVLERARGVGGRCATRTFEGQPVDFGITFFHGRNSEFLRTLQSVPATVVPEWPTVVMGRGSACQPEAFTHTDRRLAFMEGVGAFPRWLARGLDLRLGKRIVQLWLADDGLLRADADDGEVVEARTMVLALAAEQAQSLLSTVRWTALSRQRPTGRVATADAAWQTTAHPPALGVRAASAILGMTRSQACLSLIALYPAETTRPPWQAFYPDDSDVMQLASHESSKRRRDGSMLAMVYQAHARWSRERLGEREWPEQLLAEAARLFGPWAADPRLVHEHRWTYARQDLSSELSGPMLVELPGGARLGLCGDRFAPGGGLEAAWLSGNALARRLLSAPPRRA